MCMRLICMQTILLKIVHEAVRFFFIFRLHFGSTFMIQFSFRWYIAPCPGCTFTVLKISFFLSLLFFASSLSFSHLLTRSLLLTHLQIKWNLIFSFIIFLDKIWIVTSINSNCTVQINFFSAFHDACCASISALVCGCWCCWLNTFHTHSQTVRYASRVQRMWVYFWPEIDLKREKKKNKTKHTNVHCAHNCSFSLHSHKVNLYERFLLPFQAWLSLNERTSACYALS